LINWLTAKANLVLPAPTTEAYDFLKSQLSAETSVQLIIGSVNKFWLQKYLIKFILPIIYRR
jgi:hypothetical protein